MSFTLKNKGSTIASRLAPETREREKNPGSASQCYLLTLNPFTFLNFESTCPPHLSLQRRQAGVCLSNRLKELNVRRSEKLGEIGPRPLQCCHLKRPQNHAKSLIFMLDGGSGLASKTSLLCNSVPSSSENNIGKSYKHCIGEFP